MQMHETSTLPPYVPNTSHHRDPTHFTHAHPVTPFLPPSTGDRPVCNPPRHPVPSPHGRAPPWPSSMVVNGNSYIVAYHVSCCPAKRGCSGTDYFGESVRAELNRKNYMVSPPYSTR
ncbi:hypothetical protein BGZ63DRAFT_377231 [Mariannaea sp. PMI_226]|nr:hypothetical protein BGZ63DRAFT_377231 [Mariannaea sp. PMI_226]